MIAVILFLDSLGGGELLVIMLFILIFFGPDKIPSLAKGLGKGMRELKDAMNGIQSELKQNMADMEDQVAKVKESLPEINSHPLAQSMNAVTEIIEAPKVENVVHEAKAEIEKVVEPSPPVATNSATSKSS